MTMIVSVGSVKYPAALST